MRTPTVTHILSVQHWHLRHKTFVQWSRMEKKKYLFSFFRFYKFLIIKSACISKSWFFKKTPSFVYNFCTTCMDRNHISKFYFWPKFLLGFSILVFRWEIHPPEKRCSIRRSFYTILHSFSILCKDLQKVSDVMDVSAKIKKRKLARKLKSEFMIGGAVPFTILYTSVMRTCTFFWWILVSFFPP